MCAQVGGVATKGELASLLVAEDGSATGGLWGKSGAVMAERTRSPTGE